MVRSPGPWAVEVVPGGGLDRPRQEKALGGHGGATVDKQRERVEGTRKAEVEGREGAALNSSVGYGELRLARGQKDGRHGRSWMLGVAGSTQRREDGEDGARRHASSCPWKQKSE